MLRGSAVVLAMSILCAAGTAAAQPGPLRPSQVVVQGSRIMTPAIEFEPGKPVLAAASHALLDDVAVVLLGQLAASRIRIGAHTDARGNSGANLKLSQARADAVRAYLASRGVPADRLDAKGFGETVPITDNRTEHGRAQNRRIELTVVGAVAAAPGKPASRTASTSQPVPSSKAPPSPPPASAQARREAKELFMKGQQAYQAGDHARATQYFKEAYDREPAPALLYNLAQTYRVKGDRARAILYYERFLAAKPDSPTADQARQQLADLRRGP